MQEEKILFLLVENVDFFIKVIPYLKEEHFQEKVHKACVSSIRKYYYDFDKKPSWAVLEDMMESSGIPYHDVKDFVSGIRALSDEWKEIDVDWAIGETEKFVKRQEFINALISGYEAVESGKKDLTPFYKVFEDALSVSFDSDIGHDYQKDWRKRLEYYNRKVEKIPFFSRELNKLTNGGFERKRLNFVVSKTSGGKTMFLVNIAREVISQGYNVVYFTLEDGEIDISRRLDAQMSGIPMNSFLGIDEGKYEKIVSSFSNIVKGRLRVKEYNDTTNPSILDFQSYLREIRAKEGFVADVVIVDYMNLMSAIRSRHGSDFYGYYKSIAEELTGFAKKHDVAVFTATQFNRGGAKNDDPDTEDVSDSIGTMFTARFAIGLVTSKDMREAGTLGFKLMKSKYGGEGYSGVFAVDYQTGLIRDMDEVSDSSDREVANISMISSSLGNKKTLVGNAVDRKVREYKEELEKEPVRKRLFVNRLKELREMYVAEKFVDIKKGKRVRLISSEEDVEMRALERLLGEEVDYLREEKDTLRAGEIVVTPDVRKAVEKHLKKGER